MPSDSYSFIDVAVTDAVRGRFAAGDALIIFSTDLEQVIWANGPGAALFGYADVESAIGAESPLGPIARRQIMAAPGFPQIEQERTVSVRTASAAGSQTVSFGVSSVRLPDRERAILLARPGPENADPRSLAEQAISGFSQAGHFAALLDAEGNRLAASDGFSQLEIAEEELSAMVADLRHERDRLLKRLISSRSGRIPAGMARLSDQPGRYFLVVVDEPADLPLPAGPMAEDNTGSEPVAASPVQGAVPHEPDRWYFQAPSAPGGKQSLAHNAEPAVENDGGAGPSAAAEMVPAADEAANVPAEPTPAASDAHATSASLPPVRFVWRTDADSRFSAVSAEFAKAVGEPAADILGRRFRDVALAFGFDHDGDIAARLERRDTWSGRSVLWPVAGTATRIPVDLAALPIYDRDRNFEGFRGFGIARPGEAVDDPEAIGLALVPGRMPEPEEAADDSQMELPIGDTAGGPETDPFKGETPALKIVKEDAQNDKVIRLHEHRSPARERSLSPVERTAFQEIGERLRRESRTGSHAGEAEERPAQPSSDLPLENPLAAQPAPQPDEDTKERLTGEAPDAGWIDDAREQDAAAGEWADPQPPEIEAAPASDGPDRQPAEDEAIVSERAGQAEPPKFDEAVSDRSSESRRFPATALDDTATGGAENQAPGTPAGTGAEGALGGPAEDGSLEAGTSGNPDILPPQELAGHQEMDAAILAHLPLAVLVHAGDQLLFANHEFLRLTGYASLGGLEEAGGLGSLFGEPYPPDQDGTAGHRLRLRTADGGEYPVEAHLQTVPWHGRTALLLAVQRTKAEPATENTAGLAELQARLAEMRTIVDTATDGVVLIAPDGMIRSISRPAEALFGFDNADVAGKPFLSLFAIESQRAARDYLDGLAENGVASVLNDGREVIGREAQGRFIPLFMTIGRLPDGNGYCAVVRDITQWKRAEEELTQARAQAERSSSQKTEFLARVSHEIRTPLNAIIGFSELMLDEKFGPIANDRYRDYLRDINRSGNHVLDLVNDLLDISKIEAGQQEMAYEAVSLNDTLIETVAMMQPQANRERVIIRSSFASRLPEVVADLRSIRQIALNLLSNAVRYTPAGGQVIVSTAYEMSGDIVMRVRDTGIGMSQAEIEQAMKPFKQINALKRGRGDGTGLGLPLTKAMVEANRARFAIHSTPGEGTLVEVIFPSTRVLAD